MKIKVLVFRLLTQVSLAALVTACNFGDRSEPNIDAQARASAPELSVQQHMSCLSNGAALDYGQGLHAPSKSTIQPKASTKELSSFAQCKNSDQFQFGAGKADITGPAAGKVNLGSESPTIYSRGVHLRQYARSFVIYSPCNDKRVLIMQADVGLFFESVRNAVLAKISADPELAGLYKSENVMMSASHTHSGPGGQAHYNAYNIFRFGHDPQTFKITVNGVFQSIKLAHANLANNAVDGRVGFNQGELLGANKSRANAAYMNNPAAERLNFMDTEGNDVNTPRLMTLLKLKRNNGTEVGSLNWFGVHPTSDFFESKEFASPANGAPRPISSDNKGYASVLMERFMKSRNPNFVASFQQAEEGDSFTNLWYDNPEELERRRELLPANEPFPLTVAMGQKQLVKALDLYTEAKESLNGPVDYRFSYVKIDDIEITDPVILSSLHHPAALETGVKKTCSAAMGVSFPSDAAGAEPGDTEGGITAAGMTCGSPDVIKLVSDTVSQLGAGALPSSLISALVGCNVGKIPGLRHECHAEKPILFPVGTLGLAANIVPFQLFRIGNLAIIGLPWEVTTMAGRRIRQTLLDVLKEDGIDYVVINGLSNDYVSYVTTREEYAVQLYEGASTQFGPWTLAAIQQESRKLALAMVAGQESNSGPTPPVTMPTLVNVLPLTGIDFLPPGKSYGDVLSQPQDTYKLGDSVRVRFQASNPNSDVKTDSSFLFIERLIGDKWEVIARDYDPETTFVWNSGTPEPQIFPTFSSTADVMWRIPHNLKPGVFRIRFEGVANQLGRLTPYSGETKPFKVAGTPTLCP